MKPNRPILLYLPGFLTKSLQDYLNENPPAFKYKLKHFHFIINQLAASTGKDEFIPLNTQKLRSVTVWNIERYIKILQKGEFIISDNAYKKGAKSTGYKLNKKFVKDIEAIEIQPGTKTFDKIIRRARINKSHNSRMEPHLQKMNKAFMNLDFDYEGAFKWINSVPDEVKRYSYLNSLQQLKDKRFRFFKRNTTNNRLDTNLTNLKSDLKDYIIGDYVSIDLKNSQPFFLSQFLTFFFNNQYKLNKSNTTNIKETTTHVTFCCGFGVSDLCNLFGSKVFKYHSLFSQNTKKRQLFKNSVSKGIFYDDFITKFSGKITRKEVKNLMFEVLFSRNEYYKNSVRLLPFKKEKEIFASVYPYIYEAIKILKQKDHTKLPILLQKIESYIFIDVIAKQLVNEGIIPFTIHDSVIVKREHYKKALAIMKEVFNDNFGIVPDFKIEDVGIKPKIEQLINI